MRLPVQIAIQGAALGFVATTLLAQTAQITGLVTDATEAAIPATKVTITSQGTGITYSTSTNAAGQYAVPFVKPGAYRVAAQKEGFRPASRSGVELKVGQVARLDFVLDVGVIVETIQVLLGAPLIESEKAEVGQVIEGFRITQAPLNGRNYLELAQFAAGISPASGQGKGARNGDEGNFISAGAQTNQNNLMLDGVDNSSRLSGGRLGWEVQVTKPPVDAVAEFRVITSNASAEYGYRLGAKVLVSTKSGTNEVHGTAYEFLRDDKLAATNFFANRAGGGQPEYQRNQFGVSLGGPIRKNRSFFFASYEGTRIRQGESFTSGVPSVALRGGDTSLQPSQRRDIFDPYSLTGAGAGARRQPFPGNAIPESLWDPVSRNVVSLYPLPNIAGREDLPGNFYHSAVRREDSNEYGLRLDHQAGDNHRFFLRYSHRVQEQLQPGPLPLPADGGRWTAMSLRGSNLGLSWNAPVGRAAVNDLRVGYTWFPTVLDVPYKQNLNPRFGILNAPGDSFGDGLDHGWTRFTPAGFAELGSRSFWPNVNALDLVSVADSLFWRMGTHNVRVGAEYRNANVLRIAHRYRRGQLAFSGQYTAEMPNVGASRASTGNPMADFLLGWASGGNFGGIIGEETNVPYWAAFIQDDWKLSRRVTVNLGLRWELFQRASYPNAEDPAAINYTVRRFLLPDYHGVAEPEIRFAAPGRRYGEANLKNFAPRVGMAYRLTDRTVIRAGAGLYYGEPQEPCDNGLFLSGQPRTAELRIADLYNDRERARVRVSTGFPDLPDSQLTATPKWELIPDRSPTTSSWQWFIDLQQELPGSTLVTLGYTGSATSHLWFMRDINEPFTPHATVSHFDRRLRPEYSDLLVREQGRNANYNALTAKAEKRLSAGLAFLSSFTWAHNIDEVGEKLMDGLTSPETSASPHDWSGERASSGLDRRWAYVLSFVYELPFGRGKPHLQSGPASWILGGWQVGGGLSLLAGTHSNHQFSVDNQNNGGQVRGDWVRDPTLPRDERTIDRWFDAGFVTASLPGVVGNAGRNLIIVPGRGNFDFQLAKQFAMPWENHRLQFRVESFNFTNTPHFHAPDTNVGTPSAGRITAADAARTVQFGLKYVF